MSDDPRHPGVRPATAAKLLRHLAAEQASARLPSVTAGIVRDGTAAWADRRGDFGVDDPSVAATDMQYRIGSITKPFTAVLVARLRDEGLLDFNDRLEQHLPDVSMGDRTIGQLLGHTGGLMSEIEGEWWERVPGLSWPELTKLLGPDSVPLPAGRRLHYSNLGYAVLGELVARLRGRPWYDVLRTELLDPLGMRRTTYLPEAPHARGYAVHPWADLVQPEPAHDSGVGAPAGQLWSTVADLARWVAFVAGDTGDLLAADTMAELREARFESGMASAGAFGLGFQVARADECTLVGHGGSMPGFVAGLWVDTGDASGHDAVITLANSTTGMNPGKLTADLLKTFRAAEPRLAPAWVPAGEVAAAAFELTGPWYWGPSPHVVRILSDGLLHLGPLGDRGRASRFRPDGVDRWIGLDNYYSGESLRVVRRPNGEVSHLNLATFIFTRTRMIPLRRCPAASTRPAGAPARSIRDRGAEKRR